MNSNQHLHDWSLGIQFILISLFYAHVGCYDRKIDWIQMCRTVFELQTCIKTIFSSNTKTNHTALAHQSKLLTKIYSFNKFKQYSSYKSKFSNQIHGVMYKVQHYLLCFYAHRGLKAVDHTNSIPHAITRSLCQIHLLQEHWKGHCLWYPIYILIILV